MKKAGEPELIELHSPAAIHLVMPTHTKTTRDTSSQPMGLHSLTRE